MCLRIWFEKGANLHLKHSFAISITSVASAVDIFSLVYIFSPLSKLAVLVNGILHVRFEFNLKRRCSTDYLFLIYNFAWLIIWRRSRVVSRDWGFAWIDMSIGRVGGINVTKRQKFIFLEEFWERMFRYISNCFDPNMLEKS